VVEEVGAGLTGVAVGDGVATVRAVTPTAGEATPVAALIDLVGGGYVELALELGTATPCPKRRSIETASALRGHRAGYASRPCGAAAGRGPDRPSDQ
jgi:hypothetical protein